MLDSVSNIVYDVTGKSMDALWMRANAISDNIANNDTFGYKAKSVSFEDQLSKLLGNQNLKESDVANLSPKIVENSGTYGVGQNGVDMENQMIELTRNQLQYSYLQRGISDSLGLLLTAASEGR